MLIFAATASARTISVCVGCLPAAVQNAASGDTLSLVNGDHDANNLVVDKDLTIEAANPLQARIVTNGNVAFRVGSGRTVSFVDLELGNGNLDSGSLVVADSNATIALQGLLVRSYRITGVPTGGFVTFA